MPLSRLLGGDDDPVRILAVTFRFALAVLGIITFVPTTLPNVLLTGLIGLAYLPITVALTSPSLSYFLIPTHLSLFSLQSFLIFGTQFS